MKKAGSVVHACNSYSRRWLGAHCSSLVAQLSASSVKDPVSKTKAESNRGRHPPIDLLIPLVSTHMGPHTTESLMVLFYDQGITLHHPWVPD